MGGYVCEVRSTQGRRWRAGHPECVWLHISVCLEPDAVSLSGHVWVFAFVTLGVSLWVSLWVDLRVSGSISVFRYFLDICVSLHDVSMGMNGTHVPVSECASLAVCVLGVSGYFSCVHLYVCVFLGTECICSPLCLDVMYWVCVFAH